ncbi:MAG: hypothetical protein KJZ73_15190, partial [Pseudorhodoplanes sp.]|nr:hypothetical protein [Pseudorhodoplanes sp.]
MPGLMVRDASLRDAPHHEDRERRAAEFPFVIPASILTRHPGLHLTVTPAFILTCVISASILTPSSRPSAARSRDRDPHLRLPPHTPLTI